MNSPWRFLEKLLIQFRTNYRLAAIFVIGLSLPAIYWLVYQTGGIKYVYSHTMYLPILIAGILLGWKWGLGTALIAGILMGPLMPIDTTTLEAQIPINYIYRMGMFLLIGGLSGFAADVLRKQTIWIKNLYSTNVETGVPNPNILFSFIEKLPQNEPVLTMTILLNNSDAIVDVMGMTKLHQVIHQIYQNLMSRFDKNVVIVQSGVSKLWIVKTIRDIDEETSAVLDALKIPIQIDDVPFYVEFSIGAAIIEDMNRIVDFEAFTNADASARHAQKNSLPFELYDEVVFQRRKDFELLGHFHQAIQEHELFLVYQPKMNLRENKPCGLEALIRWKHPQKGLIPPDEFIPLIEETQLIHSLTDFVVEQTLQMIQLLQEHGYRIPISINVSAKNLFERHFSERLIDQIHHYGIDPSLMEVEITETALMTNPENSKQYLSKLHHTGVKISLDDYGTGYSSLAYISMFPLQVIKIDKLFIGGIQDTTSVKQIVKSTIDLAHALGYEVLAEGVETIENVRTLVDLDCDMAQGYHFAKPMPKEDLLIWIEKKWR